MYCPNCGAKIKDGDKFCPSCGTHIKYTEKVAEDKKRVCPKCGMELSREDMFCGYCGTRIGELGIKKTSEKKYPHSVATIFGYIFASFGGLPGIIFGIYLWTRKHPQAKFNGKIILAITVGMSLFWIYVTIFILSSVSPLWLPDLIHSLLSPFAA